MNSMKTRLQGLSLLERALAATTDDELEAVVATLPDDHRSTLDTLCGAREGGFTDPASRTVAIRTTAARGRMNGGLEQITTILTDPCLAECIELLGDKADNPSEADLLDVAPTLVEHHSLPVVRMMMAGSVAGEAAASVALTRLLKHDDTLALPAAEAHDDAPALVRQADEATKAKRRAAKQAKQADARARREQQQRARGRA